MGERGNHLLRRIDEVAGIPLAFAAGLTKPSRSLPSSIQSIGILMLGVIGDTLLASAIIPDLRRRYPQARITAFISQGNWGTADLLDGLDDVQVVAANKPWPTLLKLRRHRVDLFIDISQWARIACLLSRFSGAGYTIGFKTKGQYRHYPYDSTVDHLNTRHEIENFRALLVPLGIAGDSLPALTDDIRMAAARDAGSDRTVVLHPWAAGFRSELREWPQQRWAEAARSLLDDGYEIAITGGPGDFQRASALAAAIDRPGVTVLAGKYSLRQTAVLLARAACLISVNTGIMHLAAIIGTPLVGLHGPTNPRRWGPINENSVVVGPGAEEGGAYLNLGFEYPRLPEDCMGKITVEQVLSACRLLLTREEAPAPVRAPAETPFILFGGEQHR